MIDLYQHIFTRKSCRKYNMKPLSSGELKEIQAKIDTLPVLYPDIPIESEIVDTSGITGIGKVKAPHYLILRGSGKTNEDINAGFHFQLWSLWMTGQGYGTLWLGSAQAARSMEKKKHINTIAFGRCIEPIIRLPERFDRKPLEKISTGSDPRLEAARLAPSGMNRQPWYMIAKSGSIFLYKKHTIFTRFFSFPDLEMGIVLSHLFLACKKQDVPFHFDKSPLHAPEPPKGYVYFGTVHS